jgi:hypothetical protein
MDVKEREGKARANFQIDPSCKTLKRQRKGRREHDRRGQEREIMQLNSV